MKKLFLGLSVWVATSISAQYYPNNGGYGNQYPNGGYGNSYPNSNYYGEEDYYFPDDYYYEYPEDYYSDDYYRNLYTDYSRSIEMINWNRFFMEFGLNRNQINLIIELNQQFPSYRSWNSYYRMNPKRWWYDRFYALERILGPRNFVVFQNRYYNGYSPVTYYCNHWDNYYRPRYRVRPSYMNINIGLFRVDRYDYHRSVGHQYGWNQPRNPHYVTGFRNNGVYRSGSDNGFRNQNGGFRNDNPRNNNNTGGFRGNDDTRGNGGFRGNNGERGNGGFRNDNPRMESPNRNNDSGGFRGNNGERGNGGFRNDNPRMESPNRSNDSGGFRGNNGERGNGGFRNDNPRMESPNRSNDSGGFRGNNGERGNGGFR